MKGIIAFKDFIKKFIAVFASREFAFIYCLLGTFGQISHCYYLVYSISSFTGFFKVLQALLLSLFISSSLMYFVSIADSDDEEQEYKRVKRAINLFMYIEILMNMYYYCQHLIIIAKPIRVFDFLFSIIIAALIPITIKLYSNSIRAKAWIKEIEERSKEIPNQSNNLPIQDNLRKEEIIRTITSEFEKVKEIDKNYIEQLIDEKLRSFKKTDGQSIDDLILRKELEDIVREQIKKENNKK